MRIRQALGAVIGAFALLTLWSALRILTLRGDEAGLVTTALLVIVLVALCVGWPLLLLATMLILPDRLRPRRTLLVIAGVLAAIPGILATPALGRVLIDIASGSPHGHRHLVEVGLYLFPYLPSAILFREAVRTPAERAVALI